MLERLGTDGFIETASIIGIFNGLVRTADATGIPLDDSVKLQPLKLVRIWASMNLREH